jgi:hypothetical protein
MQLMIDTLNQIYIPSSFSKQSFVQVINEERCPRGLKTMSENYYNLLDIRWQIGVLFMLKWHCILAVMLIHN